MSGGTVAAMHNSKNPFRIHSAALLIGLCSCVLEDGAGAVDEQLELADMSDPVGISAEFGEQPSLGGVSSNEAGDMVVSSEKLEADFNDDGYADLAIGVPYEEISGVRGGAVSVIYGSKDGLDSEDDQVFHRNTADLEGKPESGDEFGYALAVGDFNDDGYSDLAIGVPSDEVNGVDGAGSVTVLYGSKDGLDGDDSELWSQHTSGIADDPDINDNFGYALTTGDFNDDGYADLAIGVPGEDVSGEDDAGLVHVIYGSSKGLDSEGDELWHQGSDGVTGLLEDGDGFGSALAAGDFDNDDRDDLAIGVPGEDLDGHDNAGWVHVLYGTDGGGGSSSSQGTDGGLSGDRDDIWHQDIDGIEGEAESHDDFGYSLAVGDFDDDGDDDLAIGVPGEDVGSSDDGAGAVNVIYGSGKGLTDDDNQYWHQGRPGIEGEPDDDERFGYALAAGDFDDDGHDDLAIGAPGEDFESHDEAGQVQVLYGKSDGLSSDDDQRWHQSIDDIEGTAEAHDEFGAALCTGDYDGDGTSDLVIGVPFEDVGSDDNAGSVNVIYGDDSDGLTDKDNQAWHQNRSGIEGKTESDDSFGFAIR